MCNAAVEPQLFDVVRYLRQRPVGGFANRRGGVREHERPGCGRALRKLCRLIDEPPQSLNEPPRALHALFGPDYVTFRRRIREHEPACRVCPECADDVIRIDGVALRLRHLLDRADLDRLPRLWW